MPNRAAGKAGQRAANGIRHVGASRACERDRAELEVARLQAGDAGQRDLVAGLPGERDDGIGAIGDLQRGEGLAEPGQVDQVVLGAVDDRRHEAGDAVAAEAERRILEPVSACAADQRVCAQPALSVSLPPPPSRRLAAVLPVIAVIAGAAGDALEIGELVGAAFRAHRLVGGGREIDDDAERGRGEAHRIGRAGAAIQRIVAAAAIDHVVAVTAVDDVADAVAGDRVIAESAGDVLDAEQVDGAVAAVENEPLPEASRVRMMLPRLSAE